MTSEVVEREKRRRATNREVLLTRSALRIVRPFNQQIGAWQASVARLTSMAERARAHGRDAPSQAVELDALEHIIAVQNQRFADAVSTLSGDVRTNARVTDTRRALESLTAASQRAHRLLEGGPPAGHPPTSVPHGAETHGDVGEVRLAHHTTHTTSSPNPGSRSPAGVFGPGSPPARA